MNGIEFIEKGGIVMYPILLCSVAALAIVIERLFVYWKTNKSTREFLSKINLLIKSEKIEEAIRECDRMKMPMSAVFKEGLVNRHKNREELKSLCEETGELEVVHLEKNLAGLSTIATITPLLGLLGTVTGMVSSFNAIAAATGIGETPQLAGGIAEALLTTVFGLSVAIPAYTAYAYLIKRVDNMVIDIQKNAIELVNVLVDMNSKVVEELISQSKES
ncbi:MotA/TolQ/ExbB proton channel family protein [Candidatus Poribacteria bacterium]|nr:MotA/TolQ/ExbB proton channel family protein [Candidatus Poribacteria bacterium]